MARKIFASYKYADTDVQELPYKYRVQHPQYWNSLQTTTVRSYVNKLEDILDRGDHIYKGESDGEDLSYLSESTIKEKLKNRIHDSSVTIVFISPNMKEPFKYDRNQWIPWEISYSLKDIERGGLRSRTNAILAVALPNTYGSYSYCSNYGGSINTSILFNILKNNMNNKKNYLYSGEDSYIKTVKWSTFVSNPSHYIEKAVEIKKNINNYNVVKEV